MPTKSRSPSTVSGWHPVEHRVSNRQSPIAIRQALRFASLGAVFASPGARMTVKGQA
jgi:hypothetical protein